MTQPPPPRPDPQQPQAGPPPDPAAPGQPQRSDPPWVWIIGVGCGVLMLLAAACAVAVFLLIRSGQRAEEAATPTPEIPTYVSASPTSATPTTPEPTTDPVPETTLEATSAAPESTPTPETVTVTYELSFPGARANVIYRNRDGDSEFPENVSSPWRKKITGYAVEDLPYASITARRSGKGPITCRILVDGKVAVEHTEKGTEAGVACLYYLQAR